MGDRCHGRCHGIIPEGAIRIKYCGQPPNEWQYFRNLECVTPAVLQHIAKEWMHQGGEVILCLH